MSASKKTRLNVRESSRIRNKGVQNKTINFTKTLQVKHKQNGIISSKTVENKGKQGLLRFFFKFQRSLFLVDDNFKRKDPKLLNGHKKRKLFNLEFIDTDTRYRLVTKPFRPPFNAQLLQYDFDKLVNDIKCIRLPTKEWKIKVFKRRSQVTSISFSNYMLPERSVTFEYNLKQFNLIIDGRIAVLLGAPNHINSKYDLEILLKIVNNIKSNNEMLYYKTIKSLIMTRRRI